MNDFQKFIKVFEVTGVKYQIMESFKLKIEGKLVEKGIIVYGRVENLAFYFTEDGEFVEVI